MSRVSHLRRAMFCSVWLFLMAASAFGQSSSYSLDVRGDAFTLTGDGAVFTGNELRVHGILEVDIIEDVVVNSNLSLVYGGDTFALPSVPEIHEDGVKFEDVKGTLFASGLDVRGTVIWGADNGANFGFLGENSSITTATAFIYWPGPPAERVFLGDAVSRRVEIGVLVPEPFAYSIANWSCLLLAVYYRRIRRQA